MLTKKRSRFRLNHFDPDTEPLISPLDQRRTLGLTEVAKLLGIDTETLRRYCKDGTIPGAYQMKKWGSWRLKRKELELWWKSLG